MEQVQTVLVHVDPAKIDGASRPGGLISDLEAHKADLSSEPGFVGMRISRSTHESGDAVVSVETRWRDNNALSDYTTRTPNVASIVRSHDAEIVPDTVQVMRMDAVGDAGLDDANPMFERMSFALFVPIGVIAIGLLAIYALSRIYLSLPTDWATPLAALVAISIIAIAGYFATNPIVPRWQIAGITGAVVALLAGGAIAAGIHGKNELEPIVAAQPTAVASPGAGGGGPTIVAKNVKFDQSTLDVSAGAVTITFDNQDVGVPHNFHVFKGSDATGDSVGLTPVQPGPIQDTLDLTLTEGEYFYHCDVHPDTMKGKLTVGPAKAAPPPGGPPSGGPATGGPPSGAAPDLTIVGDQIKFDKTTADAKAGSITILFDNKDTGVPHNLHLFKGSDATGDSVGLTTVTPGPSQDTLTVDVTAGTYFYHCDVHPDQMKGTLTVS